MGNSGNTASVYETKGMMCYESNEVYLREQLERLDLLIKLQLARLEAAEAEDSNADFKGLILTRKDIDLILGSENPGHGSSEVRSSPRERALLKKIHNKEERIAARVQQSWREGVPPTLELVGYLFRLTPFERDVLIILLAPEISRNYDRLYAYLQDDVTRKRPSVDLILNLLCRNFEERITALSFFNSEASLPRWQLTHFVDDRDIGTVPLVARFLKLDNRMAEFILHREPVDWRFKPFLRNVRAEVDISELLLPEHTKQQLRHLVALYRRIHEGIDNTHRRGASRWLHCVISGPYGSGKKTAAAAVCRKLNIGLLAVDVPSLVREKRCNGADLRLILREAVLLGAALYFEGMESLFREDGEAESLQKTIEASLFEPGALVFFATQRRRIARPGGQRPVPNIEFPVPDHGLRKAVWQQHLAALDNGIDMIDLDDLANQFKFTAGQIHDAVNQARYLNILENGEDTVITKSLLYKGCREQCNHRIAHLAQKIVPNYTWDDIVLSVDRMAQLKELCDHVRLRYRVLGQWGFAGKFSLGRGVNALFAGPSGTGKTMATEIIARELEMDLYKVDLSCVVSKYIGETEKNLSRVFEEAEQSNAILLFDEADALFGKRTEVKDAHDRYANIEINYLLQKIEEYEGAVILSTNMRGHLDDAFTRRLRFSIDFPFPDAESRLRIWKTVFPGAAPLGDDVDREFLAQRFKISGGNIKNVALASGFLAARENTAIGMHHVICSLKREYQKIGKICTKAEFGQYFNLIKGNETYETAQKIKR